MGLNTGAGKIRISAPGNFYLVEKSAETPRRLVRGEVEIRVEGKTGTSAEIYRVQVSSLKDPDAARTLGKELSRRFSLQATISRSESGMNRVRMGEFPTREEARKFASGPAAAAGFRDAFVVSDQAGSSSEPALALRGPNDLFRVSRSGFLFMPSSDDALLRLDGKPYRGNFDIILNGDGRITIVNELGVEEYLLGVIPVELSPALYPEREALAAQAVAARTYALKSRGRFRSSGFDLTDDVRTQVYGGAAVEQEASSAAVLRTSGIVVTYKGELIDAMYASTCGGKTEDFSLVFDAPPVPYLKSVFCAVDSAGGKETGIDLEGTHPLEETVLSDDGENANRNLELAQVLGLTGSDNLTGEYLSGTPGKKEVERWIRLARRIAERSGKVDQARDGDGDPTTRAGFLLQAAEGFFDDRKIDGLISAADTDYYLENLEDGPQVPAPARQTVAWLMQQHLWDACPDNTLRPVDPIRRGDALSLLVRWIEHVRPEIIRAGVLAEPEQGKSDSIRLKQGSRTDTLHLARNVRLFRLSGGRSIPAGRLRIIGNEKVDFHQNAKGEIDFLEVELSPTGAASDRFSPVATWETTLTRKELSRRLAPLAGKAGTVRDIRPARFGKSGRVVRLEIIGSRSSVEVNGYKARNALGLKDTLFTITRVKGRDGTVESFVFKGRGWGHGVGLCQTGAVGMARAGRSYQEILKTYYQGVEIRKSY